MDKPCPICSEPAPREGNDAFPFCSSRCRLLDLGKWLDGDYRVAGEPTFDVPDESSSNES